MIRFDVNNEEHRQYINSVLLKEFGQFFAVTTLKEVCNVLVENGFEININEEKLNGQKGTN